jgi:preprotein translocase subunit SecY
LPNDFTGLYNQFIVGADNVVKAVIGAVIIIAVVVLLVVLVVLLQDATRKISVQYAKKMQGRKMVGGQSSHIPLKVNTAGVIPVIFAQAVLSAPVTILGFIDANSEAYETIKNLFSISHLENGWPVALIIYIVLIFLFSFMYAHIQIDCEKISENLTKQGSYIPGIRSGKETKIYLSKVLNRVTFTGALSLSFIASMPYVLPMIFPTLANTSFGGTGLIIVVGVAIETFRDIEAQMTLRHYKGFLD